MRNGVAGRIGRNRSLRRRPRAHKGRAPASHNRVHKKIARKFSMSLIFTRGSVGMFVRTGRPKSSAGPGRSIAVSWNPRASVSFRFRGYSCGFDRAGPFDDFAGNKSSKIGRRSPVICNQIDAIVLKALLHRRIVHRREGGVVELLDNRRGRALRGGKRHSNWTLQNRSFPAPARWRGSAGSRACAAQ